MQLKIWQCDLVLLAIGYTGPLVTNALKELHITLDSSGHIKTDETSGMTTADGVFNAAAAVDMWLQGDKARVGIAKRGTIL